MYCRLLVYVAVVCVPVQQACETVTKRRATTTKSQSSELACLPAATALSFEVKMTSWPFLKEEKKKNSCCGQVKLAKRGRRQPASLRAPGLRSWGVGCWGNLPGTSPGLSVPQPGGFSGLSAGFSSHVLQPGALKGSRLCSLSLPWGSSRSPPCFLLRVLSVGWVTLRIWKIGFERQKQRERFGGPESGRFCSWVSRK